MAKQTQEKYARIGEPFYVNDRVHTAASLAYSNSKDIEKNHLRKNWVVKEFFSVVDLPEDHSELVQILKDFFEKKEVSFSDEDLKNFLGDAKEAYNQCQQWEQYKQFATVSVKEEFFCRLNYMQRPQSNAKGKLVAEDVFASRMKPLDGVEVKPEWVEHYTLANTSIVKALHKTRGLSEAIVIRRLFGDNDGKTSNFASYSYPCPKTQKWIGIVSAFDFANCMSSKQNWEYEDFVSMVLAGAEGIIETISDFGKRGDKEFLEKYANKEIIKFGKKHKPKMIQLLEKELKLRKAYKPTLGHPSRIVNCFRQVIDRQRKVLDGVKDQTLASIDEKLTKDAIAKYVPECSWVNEGAEIEKLQNSLKSNVAEYAKFFESQLDKFEGFCSCYEQQLRSLNDEVSQSSDDEKKSDSKVKSQQSALPHYMRPTVSSILKQVKASSPKTDHAHSH